MQSRTAARKELFDQATSPDECEKLYDESLWCLYALQDDLLQTGNPFMDEDRTTIDTCACRSFLSLSFSSLTAMMMIADDELQGSSVRSYACCGAARAWR
jgi:hypothetical protein